MAMCDHRPSGGFHNERSTSHSALVTVPATSALCMVPCRWCDNSPTTGGIAGSLPDRAVAYAHNFAAEPSPKTHHPGIGRNCTRLEISGCFLMPSGGWSGWLRDFRKRLGSRPDFRTLDGEIAQRDDANQAFVAIHDRQTTYLALAHYSGGLFHRVVLVGALAYIACVPANRFALIGNLAGPVCASAQTLRGMRCRLCFLAGSTIVRRRKNRRVPHPRKQA